MEMGSDALSDIENFEVEDNGIGFTPANRESFDTLYSDFKMTEGGKGFGRFICLKYFDNVHVDSVYAEEKTFKRRTFSMGNESDIIINEKVSDAAQKSTGTVVKLSGLKDGKAIDKKLSTIARNLVEKLLPSFLVKTPVCPQITLAEADGGESICLNDWFSNELSGLIKEVAIENGGFTLKATTPTSRSSSAYSSSISPRTRKAASAWWRTAARSRARPSMTMCRNSWTTSTTRTGITGPFRAGTISSRLTSSRPTWTGMSPLNAAASSSRWRTTSSTGFRKLI
jgi:hypothetical protein